MYLESYLKQLGEIPTFLEKYLKSPSLLRLKEIGYFCGMDYASKDVYAFEESINRFDHSLTTALIVWRLTKEEKMTLAGLFHDIATPCFSHVIDYMNEDFEKQESTEAYQEQILNQDSYLKECLRKDHILLSEVSDFKRYPIVDNERPKVCADRIDGVILTSFGWSKEMSFDMMQKIVEDLTLFENEDKEQEIGFHTVEVAKKVLEMSEKINLLCHSKEDNYMMQLLAKITKEAIALNAFSYEDLYIYNETEIFTLLKKQEDPYLKSLIQEFQTKKKVEIGETNLPKIKVRSLNPLVHGKRLLK